MTEAEEIFMAHRPLFCEVCEDGKMYYDGNGIYHCGSCGAEALDDYGKIRRFLEEHGPDSAVAVARETGVDLGIVSMFLKDGRIEIPNESSMFIKCRRCGCSLRYGRYCRECTVEMAGGLSSAFRADMGERPDPTKNRNRRKGMQYWGV